VSAAKPKRPKEPKAEKKEKPKANRKRITHQITLTQHATDLLAGWVGILGPGSKANIIERCIRYADRAGIFDLELHTPPAALAAPSADTLEGAIAAHLPSLLNRLLDHAKAGTQPGGGG
jgi:hypothetical protein